MFRDAIQYCLGKMLDPKLYEMASSCLQKTMKKERKQSPSAAKEVPAEITNVVAMDTKAKDAL
jgi:hypothetical protein